MSKYLGLIAPFIIIDDPMMDVMTEMANDYFKETQMTPAEQKAAELNKKKWDRRNKLSAQKSKEAQAAYLRKKKKTKAAAEARAALLKKIEEDGPTRFVLEKGGLGPAMRHPFFKKGGFKNALKAAQTTAAASASAETIPEANTQAEEIQDGTDARNHSV